MAPTSTLSAGLTSGWASTTWRNKAAVHMGSDPTVQEHLGDLYQKTGRLKLAASHWDRAVQEWNKTVPAEQDQEAFAKVQQKLESARVKLAKEESNNKQ